MRRYEPGDIIGFLRTIPSTPGGYSPQRGVSPRVPAVRVCSKGIVQEYVGKGQLIVVSTTLGWDVQIYAKNIVGLWNEIDDQTLTNLRMDKRVKARASRERRSHAREEQFRKQLPLPL
jgi:hypothetical protein